MKYSIALLLVSIRLEAFIVLLLFFIFIIVDGINLDVKEIKLRTHLDLNLHVVTSRSTEFVPRDISIFLLGLYPVE